MRTNDAGVNLIKRHEGLRLRAYQDVRGVWTIGYGHTGDVRPCTIITEHQADAIFSCDLEIAEDAVSQATRFATPNSNQFAALVSFTFNCGVQALYGSTLLRKYLAGDVLGAASEFSKWNHSGTNPNGTPKVIDELTRRRAEEASLFLRSA